MTRDPTTSSNKPWPFGGPTVNHDSSPACEAIRSRSLRIAANAKAAGGSSSTVAAVRVRGRDSLESSKNSSVLNTKGRDRLQTFLDKTNKLESNR